MPEEGLREHYLRALHLLRDMFEQLAVEHLLDQAPDRVPFEVPRDVVVGWRTRAAALPLDEIAAIPPSGDVAPAESPARTTRHYLGVTDSGLRVGTAISGRFLGEHRPIPMSALRDDMALMTASDVFDPMLTSDGSPLLWPVSAEVYRVFQELDEDGEDGEGDEDQDEGMSW